jgi:serine O-acetyltransferase
MDPIEVDLGFDPDQPLRFVAGVLADFRAHLSESERGRNGPARVFLFMRVIVRSAGFRLMLLHRAAQAARGRFGPLGRFASALISVVNRTLHGCSIAPTARVAGGLILPHPQGIVIGPGAVVGPRAWIFQNVTIGGAPGREGLPIIGSDARIYPGAVIAGPVRVGFNVVIGANAVVVRSIAARSLVRSPAVEIVPLPERLAADLVESAPIESAQDQGSKAPGAD